MIENRVCELHNYGECSLCAIDNGSVYNKCFNCGHQRRQHSKGEECKAAVCAKECKNYTPRLVAQHVMEGEPPEGAKGLEHQTKAVEASDVNVIESPRSAPTGTRCCTPVAAIGGGTYGAHINGWTCTHGIEWHLSKGPSACSKCDCGHWAPVFTPEIFEILKSISNEAKAQAVTDSVIGAEAVEGVSWGTVKSRFREGVDQLLGRIDSVSADSLEVEAENERLRKQVKEPFKVPAIEELRKLNFALEAQNARLKRIVVIQGETIQNDKDFPTNVITEGSPIPMEKTNYERLEKKLSETEQSLAAMTESYGIQAKITSGIADLIHKRHAADSVSPTWHHCMLARCREIQKLVQDAI